MIKHACMLSSFWTSSGLLKAIPQPSLGLVLSSHDFVNALCLWLGVLFFLLPLLCTCSSVIDQYGDHLLGCSQDPLHIQRHDALITVVHDTCMYLGLLHSHSPSVYVTLMFTLQRYILVHYRKRDTRTYHHHHI